MSLDVSTESVAVFTEFPHLDSDLARLIEYVDVELRSPFINPQSRLARVFDFTGKICVDAGCGSGMKSVQMAKSGAKLVIGVDGSKAGIARAEKLAQHYGLTNVVFVCGYLESLPAILREQGVNPVDYIHNIANIHHVTDWRRMLGIFRACLKPGGYASISWVEPSMSWAGFNIKNKVAYYLGRTPRGRIRIGRFLFGWWDRRKNRRNINEQAFFADCYAAFYKIITLREMRCCLEELMFEVVETDPPCNVDMWLDVRQTSRNFAWIKKMLRCLPILKPLATAAIRLRQFTSYGSLRTIVARAC